MSDWSQIIRKIAPEGRSSIINGLADSMPQVIKIANLSSPARISQFLAQVAHESDGFRTTTEYASGKEYNNRIDLGNRKGTNDGVIYKGRGLIQLTGRFNYQKMGEKIGADLIKNPDLAAQFPCAALTAAYYWSDHNLNAMADIGDIDGITHRINGGYNGLSQRKMYLRKAQAEINDITLAQRRLQELRYPPGGVDGRVGLLTRSALRDFQDANGLPVSGELTPETIDLLHSDEAQPRPVEPERAALTAADLKEKGSTIIAAADDVKASTVGAGLATVAGVTSSASTIASNISTVSDSASDVATVLGWATKYWPVFVIAVSLLALIYFIWKIYRGTNKVEEQRVLAARTGENVRI